MAYHMLSKSPACKKSPPLKFSNKLSHMTHLPHVVHVLPFASFLISSLQFLGHKLWSFSYKSLHPHVAVCIWSSNFVHNALLSDNLELCPFTRMKEISHLCKIKTFLFRKREYRILGMKLQQALLKSNLAVSSWQI